MSSYRQIFKSTAVIGVTQFANIGIGLVRNKAMALLLAPAGFGLAGTYLTLTGFVSGISGLGLGMSGVRQIAEAAAGDDPQKLARTVRALHWASLLSGIVGMLVLLALCVPLSYSTFGDSSHAGAIAIMSLALLCGSVSAGQLALLQGLRRLAELGKSQVAGAFVGLLASVALVYFFREQGIALYLVANAAAALFFTYWYARKIEVQRVVMGAADLWKESRGLITLGFAFLLQNLVLGLGAYLSRVIIIDQLGLVAVGLYTATWTLSNYYVGMVLKAMGADFYPRLTASANDHPTLNRLVNEQIEMGLLIAVPGVLAILAVAPWALRILYSGDFVSGAEIIRWQILGVVMQVVSWPIGFIQLAKGKGKLFVVTEIVSSAAGVLGLLGCLHFWKLEGIGISVALSGLLLVIYCAAIGRMLSGFAFSRKCLRVLGAALLITSAAFISVQMLPPIVGMVVGLVLAIFASLASLWTLQHLLQVNVCQLARQKLGFDGGPASRAKLV